MPRTFRLAILRARHDTAIAKVSDEACRRFLIEASDRSAVVQYWSDAAVGGLDLSDTWMFPWVEITADPAKDTESGRSFLASAAIAATRAAGHDLDGYDGVLVLTPPGTKTVTAPDGKVIIYGFDAGATGINRPGDKLHGKMVAVVNTACSHTFICHELGHVLGYQHTHGVLNNGADWADAGAVSTEYGSPYDIMSASTFGSRWKGATTWSGSPTFARTDLATFNAGWVGVDSWNAMGPLPARAHVYLREAGALEAAGQVRKATIDGTTPIASAVLWSAGALTRNRISLLVVEDRRTASVRRYCVEYRGTDGWDRGLDITGADLGRRAVVVHTIESSPGGDYLHYRGCIHAAVEIDSDVALPDTDLVVVVNGTSDDLASANVVVRAAATRHVGLHGDVATEERITATELREVRIPHCGTEKFPWHRSITRAIFTGSVTCSGFAGKGPPEVGPVRARWTVGGVVLDTPGAGTITARTTDGHDRVLEFDLGPRAATLTLRSLFDARAWSVDVNVSVREADDTSETSGRALVFSSPGTVEGFDASLGRAIQRCTPVELREFRLREPGCWPEDQRHHIIQTVIPTVIPGIPGMGDRPGRGPDPHGPVIVEPGGDRDPIRNRAERSLRDVLRNMIRSVETIRRT